MMSAGFSLNNNNESDRILGTTNQHCRPVAVSRVPCMMQSAAENER